MKNFGKTFKQLKQTKYRQFKQFYQGTGVYFTGTYTGIISHTQKVAKYRKNHAFTPSLGGDTR